MKFLDFIFGSDRWRYNCFYQHYNVNGLFFALMELFKNPLRQFLGSFSNKLMCWKANRLIKSGHPYSVRGGIYDSVRL